MYPHHSRTLSPHHPHTLSPLPPQCPRTTPEHCPRTTPGPGGSAGTMYPHYPRGRPIRDQEINDNQSRSAMGGSAGTLSPHYPQGQCGDIVPVLPPGLGVVRGQCTRTSGGSAGTMFGGGAGTLQGYCVLFAPTGKWQCLVLESETKDRHETVTRPAQNIDRKTEIEPARVEERDFLC